MIDIPNQLRAACDAVRRKDYPLADLIPTMQRAADLIDTLRQQLNDQGEILAQYRAKTSAAAAAIRRTAQWPFPSGERDA